MAGEKVRVKGHEELSQVSKLVFTRHDNPVCVRGLCVCVGCVCVEVCVWGGLLYKDQTLGQLSVIHLSKFFEMCH